RARWRTRHRCARSPRSRSALSAAAPDRRTCAVYAPARHLDDRSRLARGLVEPVKPGIGICLHQAAIARQMTLGMLTAAVARIEERRCRWIEPAERVIVTHISP